MFVVNHRKKPVIGILGGIGSGKSTVAAEFAKLGCKVIDADRITHELLDEPAVRKKIVACFGEVVLESDKKVDRGKLSEIAFASGDKLAELNNIIHPLALARAEQLIEQYNRLCPVKAILLDMPLLMEVGWHKKCDNLIFVDCVRQLRLKRAPKMGLFDQNQLEIRENFQISLDNKADIADNTICNSSDFTALARQVAKVFSNIVNNG